MNGAAGRREYGFDSTFETLRATPSARSACTSDSATRSSSTTALPFSRPESSKSRPVATRSPPRRTSRASNAWASVARAVGEASDQVPVAGRDEGEALALAVDHEPRRRGLHAPGGEAGTDLAPEHRRHLVAVEAVEDAAGLLRVDERRVELAGVVLRLLDRVLGDLVEHHAPHGHLGLQLLQQVPRDGLALAVLISGEQEFVGVLEGALQFGDRLLLGVGHDVVRLEAVLDVDRELAERALLELGGEVLRLDEVTDVADRGQHLVAVAQVLGDRLHLGRRLDDDQFLRA